NIWCRLETIFTRRHKERSIGFQSRTMKSSRVGLKELVLGWSFTGRTCLCFVSDCSENATRTGFYFHSMNLDMALHMLGGSGISVLEKLPAILIALLIIFRSN